MAPSRAYVPSILLLRSLLRPLPRQCSLSHRLPSAPSRPKSKTAKSRIRKPDPQPVDFIQRGISDKPGDDVLNESGVSAVEWWEEDASGNERFVSAITNRDELRKHEEQHKRLEAWSRGEEDPNEPEFRNMVIDELKKNPSFSDMQDALEAMKKPLIERIQEGEEVDKEIEAEDEMSKEEGIREAQEFLQNLLEEPSLEHRRDQILEIQAKLTEWNSVDHPEFLEAMARLNEATGGESVEEFQNRLNPYLDIEHTALGSEEEISPQDKAEMEKLAKGIADIHDLLKEGGMDPELEAEFAEMRREIGTDDWATDVFAEDGEIDLDKLERAIAKFDQAELAEAKQEAKDEDDEEDLSPEERANPELKAKIDRIMEDPRLMERLAVIKQILTGTKAFVSNVKSAPDPTTLPLAHMTTLEDQLKIAENDPEHLIALRRLRVNLLPPYNDHPFLRPFNEALRFAYVGANDDVRRVLWRSYLKAKTIPGLIENIPDDAWDILWYSQAVDWASNQNRFNHLKILQKDLASIGRDGPPTQSVGGVDVNEA
ncbi:hypothetical protein GQ43DRAFT_240088 [Delitschia confertaspora ATCC 74209]|uniref:Uncharacterized protein n=1 Tax=Delitschia confertaspora ATCC 74209 TaxID=1513339 RepID=A0A9P4JCJ9_9PLEO|nr:hypothetical protein GQ43DRAFT_240088 [Delitschia confertaspora ATCC 74209]